jgi:hypothetical protein
MVLSVAKATSTTRQKPCCLHHRKNLAFGKVFSVAKLSQHGKSPRCGDHRYALKIADGKI